MKLTDLISIILVFGILFSASCRKQIQSTTQERGLLSPNGMVVSAQPQASDIGAQILKQGGNAIDAAVAVKFALAVALPKAGNIGGGGFAMIRLTNGEIRALDFREKAPLQASRDMYLDDNGDVIAGSSLDGNLAIGVPGSVAGMVELHEQFGQLEWAKIIQPSIDLARNGFNITDRQSKIWNSKQKDFKKFAMQEDNPYIKDWQAGDIIKQEQLAQTLERIRDLGRDGFYKGETAELLINEVQKNGGIITQEDLDKYEAKWRDPISIDYKDVKIHIMPPPSSGGIALAQMLKGLEHFDFEQYNQQSPEAIHLLTELERRAYADRANFLGDEDFVVVPRDTLLSDDYIAGRVSSIDLQLATPSGDIQKGQVDIIESIETTHFSIVDDEGNAVALTTTLNSLFGSKVFVEGAGFWLNNEMDDFSVKPGTPNQFGLIGNEANAIEPEKRMLSSMTPTLVEKDDDFLMAVGSPGGSTIITSVFQVLLNVIEHDMSMQEAVNAPRFHHQWLPDRILYEKDRLSADVKQELESMGHTFEQRAGIGRVNAILKTEDNIYEGGPDIHRGDCKASSY